MHCPQLSLQIVKSLEPAMAATITPHNLDTLFRELDRLATDLRSLKAGKAPSAQELRACPLLDQWSFGFLPAACLVGAVYQHPMLGNRPTIHTSELILIDPAKRWARTWSRFYRLGEQQRNRCDADATANGRI
jgi:hypothetical protein